MALQDEADAGVSEGGDVVELINADGAGNMFIVCEHASMRIPEEFDGLGLDGQARVSHIAWDPGAFAVAKLLSARFDAPLIAQRISRLVYDCNRVAGATDAVPEKSEVYEIPGNKGLSEEDLQRRLERYYVPFRASIAAIADKKAAQGRKPLLATVHSFAPVYFGKKRDVEIGIVHDVDSAFADILLEEISSDGRHTVRANEPYGPADGVTHTLMEHGISRSLPNVMLEIRNDLIASETAQAEMAAWLGDGIERAARRLGVFGRTADIGVR